MELRSSQESRSSPGVSPERLPYQFVTPRLLKYLWKYKFTPGGRYLLGLLCLSVIGTVTVQVSVYQFFFSLRALLVGVLVAGYGKRPLCMLLKKELKAQLPDHNY